VLLVHNRYRSAMPSGENGVVAEELAMLRRNGVEVVPYVADSDDIADFGVRQRLLLPLRPISSLGDQRALGDLIERHRPDVVHLHNPFPLISPSVVRTAKRRGVPVVQTVHNYRHVCANGLYFRDGHVCTDCRGKAVPWPSVAHGCYRGSRAQSVVMATSLTVHRRTWDLVDRFLAVSEFVAEHLVDAGIDPDRVIVKPNAGIDPGPPQSTGEGFVFLGRLDPGKGALLLLDAWERSGLGADSRLVVVGDGPEGEEVGARAAELPGVRWVGAVPADEARRLVREAAIVVVPSRLYEGFPRVVVEAFAAGRPVLASDVGSLSRIVDDAVGWRAEPVVDAFAEQLRAALADRPAARGEAARERFLERFTEQAVASLLLSVYDSVIHP
jgi:glycosyltransferase involved in cell wall biosynthesis